jgi:signal transduction histidine kinase
MNQLNEFEKNLISLRYENINKQKQNLKDDIKSIINMINFKYGARPDKKEIEKWLSKMKFDKSKSDYIFVYELINKKGGDDFAKMIINPNRPDIEGKYISTNYKDINGFAFREYFLKEINKKGDSIVKYSYKKTNGTIGDKISYFYYYKNLNWIIAKGIYIEDIQQNINIEKKALENRVKKQIKQNIFFFLFFSLIAIIITYIIGKKIQSIIYEKDKKVKSTTKALAKLNKELDTRVKTEVEKNKEQQKILMQKSKFVAMGEMISLIAHQWRQPISEINAIILNMKLHYDLGKLDKNIIDSKTGEVENLLEYMSNTIDDFRTFFKPNKNKEIFYFIDSFNRTIGISSALLNEHNITLKTNIDETLFIKSYQNEFEQVILNIITNAKDALIYDKIKTPQININIYKKEKIYIEIKDNAKGISQKIIDKIFDPYFTTKEESEGTGIGLYMSKMIIEENMDGELNVQSSKDGTCFIISFE